MKSIQKNIVLVIIAALMILGGGFLYLDQNRVSETKKTTVTEQKKAVATNVSIKADGQEKKYEVENSVGKTALEVTKNATSDVKMTGEGENAFITAINGREASSTKKEFWKLVINGKDSEVGAGSYTVKEGDSVGWEIATY